MLGRGLFVRERVAAGAVLLVEAATAHVAETADGTEVFGMTVDFASMTMDVGGNDILGRDLLQRCLRSPVVNARVLALFDGWEEQGGHGRAICTKIPPLELFATDAPEDARVYEEGAAAMATEEPVDVARVQRVIRFNHFNSGRNPHTKEYGKGEPQGMGLWGLASMVNNAASPARAPPTATQQYAHGGRVMVLRAARDLAAGEEVTLDYGPGPEEAAASKKKADGGKGGGAARRKPMTRHEGAGK